jgi:Protein of unknown function (DUF3750)
VKKYLKIVLLILLVSLLGPTLIACSGTIKFGQDWRTADRSGTGIAPDPLHESEAVVQVYAARAFNWRGIFGVHTWIATKEKDANDYMVHQVVGWRSWDDLPVVISKKDIPDRAWYGYTPEVLVDLRGVKAERAIASIYKAVADYNYQHRYRMWPGPNSNSFVAEIGRQVAELQLDLPATAIGKDFLTSSVFFDKAPSATGYQFSIYGLLGLTLAKEEGLELNILGLNFGINPLKLKLKLPGIGSITVDN